MGAQGVKGSHDKGVPHKGGGHMAGNSVQYLGSEDHRCTTDITSHAASCTACPAYSPKPAASQVRSRARGQLTLHHKDGQHRQRSLKQPLSHSRRPGVNSSALP